MDGIYLTWLISALSLGVILLPVFKPPWMKITLPTFVDFFRRYWAHIAIVFIIYNSKDLLDQLDRILIANTGLDMTPLVYGIEGSLVLEVQEMFKAEWLTVALTHFYVAGFMFICYVSVFYFAFFDDRWIADRMTLSIAWVYILAIPFYLFFNVRVTGDYVPGMETLAYDLTPEISDWFRRIDPFTNGMPSLHIGIPFAVWLCLTRFDEDRRWNKYRSMVFVYILITAFAIIYLGIHWFSDIIGGMLIAALAVSAADKTSDGWWKLFDERTMNARFVTLLTNPRKAYSIVSRRTSVFFRRFLNPESRETGIMALVVFLLMFSIITWDLSDQSLPADGIEAPQGVATDGSWMATIDNRSTGPVIIVHDLSDLTSNWELMNGSIELDSPYTITGSHLAVANQSELVLYNLNGLTDNTLPVLNIPMPRPDDILLTGAGTVQYIITLSNGNLSAFDIYGNNVSLGFENGNIELVRSNGLELAMVMDNSPTKIQFSRIGSIGSITINDINASAPEEQDEILAEWNTPVDMDNATIIDFVFDDQFLAATVNVTATDRLVVYNRTNDQQWLASDAKYAVSDPSMNDGILAWSIRDHLDPTKPLNKYMDGEIQFVNLTNNHTQLLTSDALHQWNPHVLENHLVYFEEDADGETTIHIHSWTPELTVYSNIILQIGIIIGVLLVFLFVVQKQSELRQTRKSSEEE
jgi:membrane-associated phospholipid phosphatase|tara:strand:- start:16092 stop:18179 length:2088 start_codon:yes stop_codon:yes gene_type:complete